VPSPPESIRLVAQLRQAADPLRREALAAAYQRYSLRLIALLRPRLPAYLCRRVDATDLAQSAWGSFLRGLNEDRLNLDGRGGLRPLLARIAICKYHDLVEAAHAQKRDAARETHLQEVAPEGTLWEPPASEPSPLVEVAAAERVELIASSLGDERQRQILARHLGDYKVSEIANEVQLSERTVKGVLQKFRDLYAEVAGVAASGEET
jgi:DNA-directed RNA polymerase specialized sigma24 family protein